MPHCILLSRVLSGGDTGRESMRWHLGGTGVLRSDEAGARCCRAAIDEVGTVAQGGGCRQPGSQESIHWCILTGGGEIRSPTRGEGVVGQLN